MIKRQNTKLGFSLMEALVSMLILSVFFAATAKVITKKKKPEKIVYPHGYYECYYDGGSLYSGESTNFAAPEIKQISGSSCTFTPGTGKIVYKVTVIYPDNNGGFSEIVPFINNDLTIKPSKTTEKTTIRSSNSQLEYDINKSNNTYEEIHNYLGFTNSRSNVYIKNIGASGNGGGVIIAW